MAALAMPISTKSASCRCPDANTRVESAVSGQYDYVDALPVESFDKLKGAAATQPIVLKPFGYPVFVFNTAEGSAKNVEVRKAIRQALSMEDMLAAAFGSTDFYGLEGNIYPASFSWSTDAGVEGNYNVANPEGAKAAAADCRLQRRADPYPDQSAVRVPLQDGAGRGRVPQGSPASMSICRSSTGRR
jgi:ABC-type transport system substrate-binding protein